MHFNSGQSRLLKAVWWRHDELITAIMCLLPAMVIFGLFNIFPILYSGYLSLLKWDGLSDTPIFVGSANYIALFQSDSFWNSIRVTLYYMGGVTLLGLGAGLLIALALNQGVRWSGFYRTVYFTPVITSTVAAAVCGNIFSIRGRVILTNSCTPSAFWLPIGSLARFGLCLLLF